MSVHCSFPDLRSHLGGRDGDFRRNAHRVRNPDRDSASDSPTSALVKGNSVNVFIGTLKISPCEAPGKLSHPEKPPTPRWNPLSGMPEADDKLFRLMNVLGGSRWRGEVADWISWAAPGGTLS